MVIFSSPFITEGSTSSSEGSLKQTTKSAGSVMDALKCYVCGLYYNKPRILPCGHSYCETCVLSVREIAIQEFNKSRDKNAHRRGDCGFFTCPWPSCHYSMRIMNVFRWTMKNKALAKAVSIAKRKEQEREDTETQTTIDSTKVIFTLPAKIFKTLGTNGTTNGRVPLTPTAAVVQHMLQNVVTTETLDVRHCQPPTDSCDGKTSSWRSYVFCFGMAVLDQMLKIV